METYTFSATDDTGIITTVSFTLSAEGLTIGGFAELCGRAALAFGYAEKNVNQYLSNNETLEELLNCVEKS